MDNNNLFSIGEINEITIEPQYVYCRTYNATSIADKTNLLRDTALEAMRKYETDIRKRLYFTEYSAKAQTPCNHSFHFDATFLIKSIYEQGSVANATDPCLN